MKALLYLFLGGIAFADLPRLTIEHGEQRQDLRLDEVEVLVRVEGDFVETRMSLNFYNETNRNQEGEFRLPLPEGASVNHYALEVNGKMRAATVVGKEQARHAYETIKARNIDPGLVEKMEGNIYRTRIFPVLPEQGKRVSIGYVQPLEKIVDGMVYRLPFGVAEKIGKFELKIEGDLAGVDAELGGEVMFKKDESGFMFSAEDSTVEGDLVLKRKEDGGKFSGYVRKVDGEGFAYLSGAVPQELLERGLKKPESLTVVWDASAGGYSRDLEAEVEFLGKLVEELGEVSVRLMAVHGEVEDLGEFQVKGGDWKKLRKTVEGIFHDGAADWRKVNFSKLKGDRVLVFGGDESAFPISEGKVGGVFQMVRSGGGKMDKVLEEMARVSGGGMIDLKKRDAKDAVEDVLEPRLRVIRVAGSVESSSSEIVDGNIRVFAKMREDGLGEVVVSLGRGQEVLMPVSVRLKQVEGGNTVRYLWAQRRLDELARRSSLFSEIQEAEIVGHCQKYGLVSDFTSLIVLERMEDHIEFRIPPPEPELMAAYEKGLKEREAKLASSPDASRLLTAWQQRIRWHRTDFPWMDVMLLPRYIRVKKWTDAQTSVFEKEQLAQTNVAEFLRWRKEAEQIMGEGQKIDGRKKFVEWLKRIEGLMKSGGELGAKDAELPEKGEFGVSVRGLVEEPQTLSLKSGVTLKQAIEKAGGIHFEGSLSRVAVYRSGKRSIYNLLSEQYEEVKLLPGDMVVAMSYYGHWNDVDPFAESPVPIDPGAGPAVVEGDAPLGAPSFGRNGDPFGRRNEDGPGPWEDSLSGNSAGALRARAEPGSVDFPSLKGQVKEVQEKAGGSGVTKEILEAEDPWTAYQKRRAEIGGEAADFAKVAEKLYEMKEVAKARRVLTNFYARGGIHVPSLRSAAYWMMQFGDYDGAGEIFKVIGREFPDDTLLALDVMRLGRMAGGEGAFGSVVDPQNSRALMEPKNAIIAEMVMMERNRFDKLDRTNIAKHLPGHYEVFPSDIRVQISSSISGNSTYLEVTEPTGEVIAGSWTSETGGRVTTGEGVAEFMVRRAMPGDYKLEIANLAVGTYQVEVFLKWGSEEETRQMFTVSGDGKSRLMDAGVVEFGFSEE